MNRFPRSAYDKTAGMIYFARMLDKIRLHERGELAEDFHGNLGKGFDERCSRFLRVAYEQIVTRVKQGGTDEEVLQWCFEHGRQLDDNDIFIWNEFLRKVGWNDAISERLAQRKKEAGIDHLEEVRTMTEYFEYDEGRKQA